MGFDTKWPGINISLHLTSWLKNTVAVPMDTRQRSTSTSHNLLLWYTALRRRTNRPSPTNRNL